MFERGNWAKRDDLDWNQKEILVKQRYKSECPYLTKQLNRKRTPMYMNEVVGGGSIFYGGASLRLRVRDFDKWPIKYEDLEKYYTQAEKLLEVHGETGVDVCEPPRSAGYPYGSIELSGPATRIYNAGKKLNLHPFKLPLAVNFHNSKKRICERCNTCDGFPCKISTKNDLDTTLLADAQKFGTEIVTNTIVTSVKQEGNRITTVECVDKNTKERFEIHGNIVLLAAGAINSAAILLRSNIKRDISFNFVGKYLMRHCNAVVTSLFPFQTNPNQEFCKQLCFSDFYEDKREEWGTATGILQDIATPDSVVIKHHAPPGTKTFAAFVTKYLQNLLCIAEDSPREENRVTISNELDPYGVPSIEITHNYCEDDYKRLRYLQHHAKRILRAAGGLFQFTGKMLDSFSHAVGTIRFGDCPSKSALDSNCKYWGLENLYVVDGSVMPTSGGVNPSLTIAANALRVSEHIIKVNKK